MSEIHPTAVVDRSAELGEDVCIGPYCHVGPGVSLGDRCALHNHVTLLGPASFGAENVFFPHCVLGSAPQDLKYKGGPTRLEVGEGNTFREFVTAHRGTEVDQSSDGVTRIGDRNLFMIGVHIAHDAELGSHLILANNVLIAGHVRLEDCVNIGGSTALHHFVTVGRYAFVGGMTRVTHDVPPYMKVQGYDQAVRAVNSEGMRRWKIPQASIDAMKSVARLLYARRPGRLSRPAAEVLREIKGDGLCNDEHVAYLVGFLEQKLAIGVYGRVREHARFDSFEDRAAFYSRSEGSRDDA